MMMNSSEVVIPSLENPANEYAVIDLGSNSFHLLVARESNNTLKIISRLKQQVQLAAGLDKHHILSEEAIKRGLKCLSLFTERLQSLDPAHIRVVATYALRTARNADIFLKKAKKVFPYPIEIISGPEEARLIYFGVSHTLPEEGKKLVIDIGGGSTEFALGEKFSPLIVQSCPIGCVGFTQHYFPTGKISREKFDLAVLHAQQQLENISWRYEKEDWQLTVGASGSIKTIHAILIALGENGTITLPLLEKITQLTLKYHHIDKLSLPGLSEQRRPIFIGGLVILMAIFKTFSIHTLQLSSAALREGVLYEMRKDFRHNNIRQRTANNLIGQYSIDLAQAKRVLLTTKMLYQKWCQYEPDLYSTHLSQILFWAATLHEVGLHINLSGIQKHSAYILANSDLPGFNQEQQDLLSTLVRFHRKTIKIEQLPAFSLFKLKHVISIIRILRLAILLNNQRHDNGDIYNINLEIKNKHVKLFFPNSFFEKNLLIKMNLRQEKNYWKSINDSWKLSFLEN